MGNRKDLYKDIIIKPLSAFSEETEEKKEAECRGIEFIGKRNIADYRYIIGVDLASKKTGMCLFELETRKPVYHTPLIVKDKHKLPSGELEELIDDFFNYIEKKFGASKDKVCLIKEAMPLQAQGASTIKTFIALARSHAVLDNYCYFNGIDVYSWTGVYPVSCRAYYKKILQVDKTSKEDIAKYLKEKYHLYEDWTLDETDALSLIDILVNQKYNKELKQKVAELKLHCSQLEKSAARNKARAQYIQMQRWYLPDLDEEEKEEDFSGFGLGQKKEKEE